MTEPITSTERERRDAIARGICARLCNDDRTCDELAVIDDVLAGIEHGAETMGPLDLERDERDWDEEAAQECRDLLAYLAMRKVAAAHRARRALREAAAAELRPEPTPSPVIVGLRELRDALVVPTRPTADFAWESAVATSRGKR